MMRTGSKRAIEDGVSGMLIGFGAFALGYWAIGPTALLGLGPIMVGIGIGAFIVIPLLVCVMVLAGMYNE